MESDYHRYRNANDPEVGDDAKCCCRLEDGWAVNAAALCHRDIIAHADRFALEGDAEENSEIRPNSDKDGEPDCPLIPFLPVLQLQIE